MDKVSILINLFTTYVVKIAGLNGWIAQAIIKYGGRLLYDFIMNQWRKLKRKSEQTVAKEKLDKVVADPKSKVEERADAYADYINSGR